MPAYAAYPRSPWPSVLLIILAITAARLIYLAFFCPYTLVEDEAWYWEWSRSLERSYYSKGPGVAWTIAASVAFFRQFGIETSEVVIRFPAVISGAILMLAIAGLTRDTSRAAALPPGVPRTARTQSSSAFRAQFTLPLLATLAIPLAPIFQITPLLMTIDIPYLACWALAAWAGWRALRGSSRWAWPALGAAIGIGFLFKYTILLLIPGVLLFGLLSRSHLRLAQHWPRWLFAGAALFALALLPVIIWNAQHDWPTIRHLLGHLGVAGGDVAPTQGAGAGWTYKPVWTIEFLAAQMGMIGPLIFIMLWGTITTLRRRHHAERTDHRYLLACALPILLFYLLVTLLTRAQANWPAAGYITLFPLAAWLVSSAANPALRLLWFASIAVGLATAVFSLRLDLIAESRPMQTAERAAQRLGLVKQSRPLIPLGRIFNADVMASDVHRRAIALAQETGREPFIIAQHYGRASLLAFYMPGQPTVYCSSAHSGGRRTQYDLWPHTSLDDLPALRGRPAILIGGTLSDWQHAFEHVRQHGRLHGETKPGRITFLGINYRGFPRAPLQPVPRSQVSDVTEDQP